jgi:hypothetical protein
MKVREETGVFGDSLLKFKIARKNIVRLMHCFLRGNFFFFFFSCSLFNTASSASSHIELFPEISRDFDKPVDPDPDPGYVIKNYGLGPVG